MTVTKFELDELELQEGYGYVVVEWTDEHGEYSVEVRVKVDDEGIVVDVFDRLGYPDPAASMWLEDQDLVSREEYEDEE